MLRRKSIQTSLATSLLLCYLLAPLLCSPWVHEKELCRYTCQIFKTLHSPFRSTPRLSVCFIYSASLFCSWKAGRLKSLRHGIPWGSLSFCFFFVLEGRLEVGWIFKAQVCPLKCHFHSDWFLLFQMADLGVWIQGNFDLQSFKHFEL